MNHGIKLRIAKLKEARKVLECEGHATVFVPGSLTTVEVDINSVLEAIDKEIAFLEKAVRDGGGS